MRRTIPEELEAARVLDGEYGSDSSYGLVGGFVLFSPVNQEAMLVMSSGVDSETRWEHVSVSLKDRTPTWEEMCFVKNAFWRTDETVIQYHPRESEYVNFHPFCLHLWKPMGIQLPLPPMLLIGPLLRQH